MRVTGKKKNITDFWVAGITYRNTDVSTRSAYAINQAQYADILKLAQDRGVTRLFILSTCNRTEIYGFASQASELTSLISPHHAVPGVDSFHNLAYIKNGLEACRHLFSVAAGLDSQLLGDYEIVGQVKAAVNFSRKAGFIGPYLDRIVNCALQSAKAIRTNTRLSNGTVSVAYAAVQHMKSHYAETLQDKKVLLVGTGKIGRNACKSLIACLPSQNITVINRTASKAVALAQEFGMQHAPFSGMQQQIDASDIVIVATNAELPIINAGHLSDTRERLVIDLSIPNNVAPEVHNLPHTTLINVDELSRIKDETLQAREAEVPLAEVILDTHLKELENWYGTRIILHTVEDKLKQLHTTYHNSSPEDYDYTPVTLPGKNVHSIIASLAVRVKQENTVGCHCIAAMNEFIGTPVA